MIDVRTTGVAAGGDGGRPRCRGPGACSCAARCPASGSRPRSPRSTARSRTPIVVSCARTLGGAGRAAVPARGRRLRRVRLAARRARAPSRACGPRSSRDALGRIGRVAAPVVVEGPALARRGVPHDGRAAPSPAAASRSAAGTATTRLASTSCLVGPPAGGGGDRGGPVPRRQPRSRSGRGPAPASGWSWSRPPRSGSSCPTASRWWARTSCAADGGRGSTRRWPAAPGGSRPRRSSSPVPTAPRRWSTPSGRRRRPWPRTRPRWWTCAQGSGCSPGPSPRTGP